MATTATAQELAEYRYDVEVLHAQAECTLGNLILEAKAGNRDNVERLAAELLQARRDERMVRRTLGDMEAGAGDWHACDTPECCA